MNYCKSKHYNTPPKKGGLSTRDDSVLELFHKDLYKIYDLKDTLEHEGIDNYPYSPTNSLGLRDNSLLQARNRTIKV